MEQSNVRKYLAEFIGTCVLVTFGCGTAAALGCDGANPNAAYIATAFAFGLSIVAMAYSIGNVSGCHINPAVSIGMRLRGNLTNGELGGYLVSQFLGGILGAALVGVFVGFDSSMGTNGLYNGDVLISFVIEVVMTFVFVLVVLGATDKAENASVAGLVIGLSLALIHIFGIHFTGTSVNPARSFGVALLKGGDALGCVWVFLLAPAVGGALAALVYNYLMPKRAA
jgi:aquaporin Z